MAEGRFTLGVHIGQQGLSMDALRALWRRLDTSGIDWISVWDHHYEAPPAGGTQPHFETVATLGALAAETEHARLGCLVFYVGYRNPALLAKVATTLDHLSGGRFELGLGAGWHEWEARAYGYEFPGIATRLEMLDEGVQIARGLLTRERTTFRGRHFRVEDASCLPRPVQERLPIWIGGIGERRTLRLAARHADGWNAAYVPPAEFARLAGVLDRWCEREGRHRPLRRTVNVSFNLASDAGRAARERERLLAQWGPAADRLMEGALLGAPDDAVKRILEYREAGADGLNVALRAPWDARALDAFLDEVVPAVRAAP